MLVGSVAKGKGRQASIFFSPAPIYLLSFDRLNDFQRSIQKKKISGDQPEWTAQINPSEDQMLGKAHALHSKKKKKEKLTRR